MLPMWAGTINKVGWPALGTDSEGMGGMREKQEEMLRGYRVCRGEASACCSSPRRAKAESVSRGRGRKPQEEVVGATHDLPT